MNEPDYSHKPRKSDNFYRATLLVGTVGAVVGARGVGKGIKALVKKDKGVKKVAKGLAVAGASIAVSSLSLDALHRKYSHHDSNERY